MNVRTLCLGILHFGDATGYEINKMASDGAFSHFIEASYGSIYPALTKLQREGLLTSREEQEPGNPPRKVYSITDTGHEALMTALGEEPGPDVFKSEFLFVNLLGELQTPERLAEICAARVIRLQEECARLEEITLDCDHPGSRFAVGYGLALNEAALRYLKTAALPGSNETDAPGTRILAAE